ncbi:hypothetical protein HZH66_010810 [Vespula vulgaris]|uniref:Uncharacterized protein n=1 Tax=Vespula vulgaris TaxID=7454 RepID=A0A834JGR6_VESVU|nr:hypothetical protein HZH66_010810 [Vespula vulgaris]
MKSTRINSEKNRLITDDDAVAATSSSDGVSGGGDSGGNGYGGGDVKKAPQNIQSKTSLLLHLDSAMSFRRVSAVLSRSSRLIDRA